MSFKVNKTVKGGNVLHAAFGAQQPLYSIDQSYSIPEQGMDVSVPFSQAPLFDSTADVFVTPQMRKQNKQGIAALKGKVLEAARKSFPSIVKTKNPLSLSDRVGFFRTKDTDFFFLYKNPKLGIQNLLFGAIDRKTGTVLAALALTIDHDSHVYDSERLVNTRALVHGGRKLKPNGRNFQATKAFARVLLDQAMFDEHARKECQRQRQKPKRQPVVVHSGGFEERQAITIPLKRRRTMHRPHRKVA